MNDNEMEQRSDDWIAFNKLGTVHLLKVDDGLLMYHLVKGDKAFEVRKDDRGFKVGDLLVLALWNGGWFENTYTIKRVSYILPGGRYGVQEGYCIMAITDFVNQSSLSNDDIFDLAFTRKYDTHSQSI